MTAIPTRTTAATRTARSPKDGGGAARLPRHEGGRRSAEAFLIGDTMSGGYGAGPDILHDCTIAVNPGEIAVIVGPNGAGKSTAMKAVFGMLNVRKGSVRLDGEDITDLSPQARVLKGMGFVPQTSNIFPSLTVEENLEMGAYTARTISARRWSRSSPCSRS
jgi:branched-chain amino acid transport system ATP-binding protein